MSRNNIPEEICIEILLRLPVKSACVCKCVSKNWLSLISNPSFVRSHLNLAMQTNNPSLILNDRERRIRNYSIIFYSISHNSLQRLLSTGEEFLEYAVELDCPLEFSFNRVELMGCWHGLVCLWFNFIDSCKGILFLWNPATKEYKELPKSPYANGTSRDYDMFGLGYDCKSGDYKLVARWFRGVVEVYSLRLNSWTSIENVPYHFNSYREVGVLFNKDLHWLAEAQDCSQVVVSFDIGDQIFKEIQLPPIELEPLDSYYSNRTKLGVLGGCLCFHVSGTSVHSEVWVMQDYGVKESWIKLYMINHERISNDHFPSLLWSFKSGELLVGFYPNSGLVIYDPKDESVRKPNTPRFMHFNQVGCYYESLVSLSSGTYVGRIEEEGRAREKKRMKTKP